MLVDFGSVKSIFQVEIKLKFSIKSLAGNSLNVVDKMKL